MCAFALLRRKAHAPLAPAFFARLTPHPEPSWHHLQLGAYDLLADRPIHSDAGAYCLGDLRLDNARELAAALALPPDTAPAALVLAAWRRWGDDLPDKLHGDFALVLLEPAAERLLALRDAVGTRPLCYHRSAALFALASSAGALASLAEVGETHDRRALLMWLHNGYDDRLTLFSRVQGLAYGHALSRRGDRLRVWRWWHPERIAELRCADPRDYGVLWRETLRHCVADRCHGDLVGTHLSGGLDSSSVTALAKQAALRAGFQLRPYCHRFPTLADCDESSLSAAAAQFLGLAPHWVEAESLPLFVDELRDGRFRESPFLGFSAINAQILSDLATAGGQVLLSGHGGDTMSTGIPPTALLLGQLQRGHLAAAAGLRRHHGFSPAALAWRLLEPFLPDAARRWRLARYGVRPPWLLPAATREWRDFSEFQRRPLHSLRIDRAATYDMLMQGANGIRRVIHHDQRQAEAYGVEVRFPYFDRRMVEVVLAIPPEHIQAGPLSKRICREQMQGLLPEVLLTTYSKPKIGAFYHKSMILCRESLGEMMRTSILAELNLIDGAMFMAEIDTYLAGHGETIATFYSVIMLENWLYNQRNAGNEASSWKNR